MDWRKLLHYLTVLCNILSEILEETTKHNKYKTMAFMVYHREESRPLLDPRLVRRVRP